MADATMFQGSVRTAPPAHRAAADVGAAAANGKLPLHGSVMLIVLGSGGCWFVLTALARWLLL